MKATIRKLLLGLTLASLTQGALAAFADPLDLPSRPSALAAHGLINGLAMAGPRVVAVGQRGHVLTSDDRGEHWRQAEVPVSADLTAVSFANDRDGWAVGQGGVVLVSHDGGDHWTRQLDGRTLGPLLVRYYTEHASSALDADALARLRADAQRFADEGPDKPFLDVWFEDAKHGFVVGAFNLILHTDDGGQTWVPWLDRSDNPKSLHLYAVRPVGGDVYIVGEQGLVMKLDRQAQRFRALALPYKGTLFGVIGDAGSVIVYGLRGNALRSTDGGQQWTSLNSGATASLTAGVRGAHGPLLLGQTGQLLRSEDGGASFVAIPTDQRVPGSALLLLPDDVLIIGGPRGLQRVSIVPKTEAKP